MATILDQLAALRNEFRTVPLDAPATDDPSGPTFAETIPAPPTDPLEALEHEQLRAMIGRLLDTLPVRERAALALRYGLDGARPLSLAELAGLFGMTKQGAARIAGQGLADARERLAPKAPKVEPRPALPEVFDLRGRPVRR